MIDKPLKINKMNNNDMDMGTSLASEAAALRRKVRQLQARVAELEHLLQASTKKKERRKISH
jgi:hypothetical protein